MSCFQCLSEDLGIPDWACNGLSADRVDCVVPVEWFECVQQRWNDRLSTSVFPISNSLYESLGYSDAKLLLSPSCNQCIAGWHRLSVVVIHKSYSQVFSLADVALCTQSEHLPTYTQIQAILSERQRRYLLSDAVNKYRSAIQSTIHTSNSQTIPIKDFKSFVDNILVKLYLRHPLVLSCDASATTTCDSDASQLTDDDLTDRKHASLMLTHGVIESSQAFYITMPFVRYTLADLIALSPSRVSNTAKQFIVYQLLQAVRCLHTAGLSIGNLRLKDIAVDDHLWIRIPPPPISSLCWPIQQQQQQVQQQQQQVHCDGNTDPNATIKDQHDSQSNMECSHSINVSSQTTFSISSLTQTDLPHVVHCWVHGEISNFDYLMFLNQLAGRSVSDPNHYPLMPWVMDFSCRDGGYRDLTRTKYRLNKGDEQLDLTYEMAKHDLSSAEPTPTPFHVSDYLSDITYYVYMARRTEKSVLCRLVRHRWVPAHYPATLERLYQWTPDECIPEFFTDPTIFTSIHDDLPDLELPSWATSATDFIAAHRDVLEGKYVSDNLHHWIDLTFGYKLSGASAIQSKNVCLQLVDNHQQLVNHGVVQLFTCKHPARCSHLDTATQSPLAALELLESVNEFSLHVTHSLPPQRTAVSVNTKYDKSEVCERVRARDMQVIGCLTAELFLSNSCWSLHKNETSLSTSLDSSQQQHLSALNLTKRYMLLRNLLCHSELPLHRSVRQAVFYLLNLSSTWTEDQVNIDVGSLFVYPSVGFDDLPPPDIDMLLHPAVTLFNFPDYFHSLHQYLLKYNELCSCGPSTGDEVHRVENDKVAILAQYLTRMTSKLGREGLEIVIPYVQHLLTDLQSSAAQSAWLLFHPIAQALGPSDTSKYFLSALVRLFDCDETSVKYLKVYHRSFIIQLIVRLGLETFLNTFSTRLVEAAAGYKDFLSTDGADVGGTDGVDVGAQFNHSIDVTQISESDIESESTTAVDAVFETDLTCDTDYGSALPADDDDTSSISGISGSNIAVDASADLPLDSCEDPTQRSLHTVQSEPCHFTEDNTSLGEFLDQPQSVVVVDLCNGEATVRNVTVSDMSRQSTISHGSMHSQNSFQSRRSHSADCNVRSFAADTLKWLSERLGPVLTAKYISRNLLRMLTLCYIGDDQLKFIAEQTSDTGLSLTCRPIVGDRHTVHILDCLSHITQLFGQQFLLLQYIHHIKDLVSSVFPAESVTVRGEASIIACLSLLVDTLPDMTDKVLLDTLQGQLLGDILLPLIRLVTSVDVSFPSGSVSRRIIVYKLLDVLYIICRRIGFERTREDLTESLQMLFNVFSVVHSTSSCSNDAAVDADGNKEQLEQRVSVDCQASSLLYEIRVDGETRQLNVDDVKLTHKRQSSLTAFKQHSLSPTQADGILSVTDDVGVCQDKNRIHQELLETFTPHLAYMAYIPFCRLTGSIHMSEHLSNDDLLRQLCTQYEETLAAAFSASSAGELSNRTSVNDVGRGDSVSVEGNKLVMHQLSMTSSISSSSSQLNQQFSNDVSANSQRHLRGNWLAYWEHEVGRSDRDTTFRFQQINLQKFTGHTSQIRAMCVLDNENSFVSASKDRTVRLWSLRNCSDGSASVNCQWTFSQHKKPLLGIAFIESVRLLASTDGNLHIWDPFTPCNVRPISLSKMVNNSPGANVSHVVPLPAPSCSLITATNTDCVLRVVDVRTGKFSHEFNSAAVQTGAIHSLTVSPDGHLVAIGYTTGIMSTIDIRTGLLLASWKAHETDILDVKAVDSRRIVTSSVDQTIAVWRPDDGKQLAALKGCNDTVHCMCVYKDILISASTSNRIGVYSSLDSMAELSTTKLKSDVVRGPVSSIAVLPLNRLLLLGTDSGIINLLA